MSVREVPKGFHSCLLGDVITLQRGFDLPSHERRSGDVPVVSSSGVTGWHNVAKVKAPGVVTGRYGTLGEVFYIEQDFWALNTTLFVSDFKGNQPKFVSYLLRTLSLKTQNAAGAVPGINRNVLHKIPIVVPEFKIRERITEILSNYDLLIDNNTSRIALLEESIHRLYKEWFVYLRFPGCDRVKVIDGVPEGWRRVTLNDISLEVRQGIHPSQTEPNTPYVGLEHIPRQSIALTNWGLSRDVDSNKFKFAYRDILFGKIRPYFHKVVTAPMTGICSSDTIVMRPKTEEFFGMLLALASSVHFVDFASKTSKEGSKMPRADWKVMKQYPILVPSQPILNDFNSFVINSVSQIENLIFTNQKLREARDLLLPRLMSGSIPV